MSIKQHWIHASDGPILRVIEHCPLQDTANTLTVVMAHGYALDHRYWHHQVPALTDAGYRVVLWDQRGHGKSGKTASGSYRIPDLGKDLHEIMRQIVPTGPVVLVGHSMGGMTIMSYAGAHITDFAERVVGVGLLSTSAGDLHRVDWGLGERGGELFAKAMTKLVTTFIPHQGFVRRFHELCAPIERPFYGMSAFASLVPDAELELNARMLMETDLNVLPGFAEALKAHDEKSSIAVMADVPCLVLVGEDDVLTPPWHSEALAAHLNEAELVRVQVAGHILAMEHPELLNEELLRLLGRVTAPEDYPRTPITRHLVDRRPGRGKRKPLLGLRQSLP